MTYYTLAACQKQCLTDCWAYFQEYKCKFNLTKVSLVYGVLYIIFGVILGLLIWKGYDTQKRRMGYTRIKNGCCFKYLPPQQRAQEMQQRVYVEGPDGDITEVQENYQNPLTQNQSLQMPTTTIQPDLPSNTAPQF